MSSLASIGFAWLAINDRMKEEGAPSPPNQSSSPAASSSFLDGQALAIVLELVHWLQLERGTTCVWVASHGSLPEFFQRVTKFRALTSRVCRWSDETLQAGLQVARWEANNAIGSPRSPEKQAMVLHTVLSQYSVLIRAQIDGMSRLSITSNLLWPIFLTLTNYKEALGVERAIISGCLALPVDALAYIQPLRGALVLSLSNQKAYLAAANASSLAAPIRSHTSGPTLTRLIKAAYDVTPELAALQERLHDRFDIEELRSLVTSEHWWTLLSDHIDKLQAMLRAILNEMLLNSDVSDASTPEGGSNDGLGSDSLSPVSSGENASTPGVDPSMEMPAPAAAGTGAARKDVPWESTLRLSAGPTAVAERMPLVVHDTGEPGGGAAPPEEAGRCRLRSASDEGAPLYRHAVKDAATWVTLGSSAVMQTESIEALQAALASLPSHQVGQMLVHLYDERLRSPQSHRQSPVASRVGSGTAVDLVELHARRSSTISNSSSAVSLLGFNVVEPSGIRAARLGGVEPGIAPPSPLPRDWIINLEELLFQRRIGAGVAGTTYAASWNGVRVAVKVAGSTTASLEGWQAEVAVLANLRHPNVVQYLGCVMAPPTFCLVLEYCEGGDVFRALRRPTSPGFFMNVSKGAAAGIAYLHKRNIIHRDLKSANVLLDKTGRAKITDFGVSTPVQDQSARLQQKPGYVDAGDAAVDDGEEPLTAELGTYRWMAPEVIRHEGYSKSADIFSYGMLLFELLTHQMPFQELTPLQSALAVGLQGVTPPLPRDIPRQLAALISCCWSNVPSTRPLSNTLLVQLTEIEAALTPSELSWLNHPTGHRVYMDAGPGASGGGGGGGPGGGFGGGGGGGSGVPAGCVPGNQPSAPIRCPGKSVSSPIDVPAHH